LSVVADRAGNNTELIKAELTLMKLDGALQESKSLRADWDALVSFPP